MAHYVHYCRLVVGELTYITGHLAGPYRTSDELAEAEAEQMRRAEETGGG